MLSNWKGSKRQAIFLETYRNKPKQHIAYFIFIHEDNVCKVGRTCRPLYRFRNLRQSLYKDHTIYSIHCINKDESADVERHMKKVLLSYLIAGEWYKVSINKISEIIDRTYPHLTIAPYHEAQPPLYRKVPDLNVPEFNISLC
jgi:hypothetical protein